MQELESRVVDILITNEFTWYLSECEVCFWNQ
jgi:hypothetical protein